MQRPPCHDCKALHPSRSPGGTRIGRGLLYLSYTSRWFLEPRGERGSFTPRLVRGIRPVDSPSPAARDTYIRCAESQAGRHTNHCTLEHVFVGAPTEVCWVSVASCGLPLYPGTLIGVPTEVGPHSLYPWAALVLTEVRGLHVAEAESQASRPYYGLGW